MAVTVGEVNAVLTARDEMSAQLKIAQQNVKDLEKAFVDYGGTVGAKLPQIETELASARAKVDELKGAMGGASESAQQFSQSGTQAAGVMEQMDRMATRVVERMLILLAIRGTIQFIEGLFANATKLEELSTQLDLTVGKIQQLQYVSEQSNVPFTSMASAIDTMTRKLATDNGGAAGAVYQLGLKLSDLEAMAPAAQFETLAAAIATIPDKAIRAGLEIALFGSDKVDGAVMHLKEFEEESTKVNRNLSDDQVKALADASKGWAAYWEATKSSTSRGIASLIELFESSGITKYLAALTTTSGLASGIAFNSPKAKDIELPSEGQGPQIDADVLKNRLAANFMRGISSAAAPISDQQFQWLGQLKAMNELTAQNAEQIGVNASQYREYTAKLTEADGAMKQLFESMKKHDEELENELERTMAVTDMQRSMIEGRYAMGKSAQEIADDLNLPVLTIHHVTEEIRVMAEGLKTAEKQAVETGKAIEAAFKEATAATATALAQLASATGQGPATASPFDAAVATRDAANAKAMARLEQAKNFSGPGAEDAAKAETAAAFAEMAAAAATFTNVTTQTDTQLKAAADGLKPLPKAADSMVKSMGEFSLNMQDLKNMLSPDSLTKAGIFQSTISSSLLPSLSIAGGNTYAKGAGAIDSGFGGGPTFNFNIGGSIFGGSGQAEFAQQVSDAVMSVARQGRRLPNG